MKISLPKTIKLKRSFRTFTAALAIISLLNITLIPYYFNNAQAGTLTQSKVIVADSRPSASTTHTFTFTTATTGTIQTITFQYCTDVNCGTPAGVGVASANNGSVTNIGAGTTTSNDGTDTITYTVTAPAEITSGTAITIPFTSVSNPSGADTAYYVRVITNASGPAEIDRTTVAFATVSASGVSVQASVDSTFSLTVTGVATSQLVNGATTNITTTDTTIPFSTLVDGASKIGAHDVKVVTNANNGYQITLRSAANPPLADGTKNLDSFTGTNDSPSAWSSPAGTAPSDNTGFFGYTTNDSSLTNTGDGVDRFTNGANKWAGVTDTASEVASSTQSTVSTGETTRVGWQAEVNEYQPNGSYTGTIVFVATPTY